MIDDSSLATIGALARTIVRPGCSVVVASGLPRVKFWFSEAPTEPVLGMFEPKVYVILQGEKLLSIAGQTHSFGLGHCALSTICLPFTAQVLKASCERPYIAIELEIDPNNLAEIFAGLSYVDDTESPGFAQMMAGADVLQPLARLIGLLEEPSDISFMAPLLEREVFYRLSKSILGPMLLQVFKNPRLSAIRSAIDWIRTNPNEPMRIPEIAARIGMSVTSFHRHFKAVTSTSPLAYQRQVRLLGARQRLLAGDTGVTTAAFDCGYSSASQFSREYKRMFGVAPVRDAAAKTRLAG